MEEAAALSQVGVAATAKAIAPLSYWAKAKAKMGNEASRLCCQGILGRSIARCKFLLYITINFYLCVIVGEAPVAPYKETDVRNIFQA